jgi:uncharacterized RDD family membrane protein YckC
VLVLASALSARADSSPWKAARIWIAGGETGVWVVASSEPQGSALANVQFWHAPVRDSETILPRQRPSLPPIVGNPVAIGADAGGLRILFSDLTTCDYFLKRASTPGANWQEQSRMAPMGWCGDATEPISWALIETEALTQPTTESDDEAVAASQSAVATIPERLTILRLENGVWNRAAGPHFAESGKRFWCAARAGALFMFWDDEKQIFAATFQHDHWSVPEPVINSDSIAQAWAATSATGPVFMVGRKTGNSAASVELYQRRDGAWSLSGRLREGNEFLSIDPRAAALGIAGDHVVVARRAGKGQVEFGSCDLSGARPVRFEALSLQREQAPTSAEWQDAIVLGLVLGMMTLVLWLRRRQVAAPVMLPEGFIPAAIWRRALASILDFVPAILILLPWWIKVVPETAAYGDFQTLSHQMEDPEVMAKVASVQYVMVVVYGLWCMIWEFLIATTPGKYLFGCHVLSVFGGRPGPRQVFIRNLIRIIMVAMGWPGLIVTLMMMVMVTRNRQRVGDLLAGTIVVEQGVPQEEAGEDGGDDLAGEG